MAEKNKTRDQGAAQPQSTTPGNGLDDVTVASAASPAASPAPSSSGGVNKAGRKRPVYLYRFQFVSRKGGKSGKPVWLEIDAGSEKEAWKKAPEKKLEKNILDYEYTGVFEIHEYKQ